jgi:hypothetical protein
MGHERRGLAADARPLDRLEVLREVRRARLGLAALAHDVECLGRSHAHGEAVVERVGENQRERNLGGLDERGFGRVEKLEVRARVTGHHHPEQRGGNRGQTHGHCSRAGSPTLRCHGRRS